MEKSLSRRNWCYSIKPRPPVAASGSYRTLIGPVHCGGGTEPGEMDSGAISWIQLSQCWTETQWLCLMINWLSEETSGLADGGLWVRLLFLSQHLDLLFLQSSCMIRAEADSSSLSTPSVNVWLQSVAEVKRRGGLQDVWWRPPAAHSSEDEQ